MKPKYGLTETPNGDMWYQVFENPKVIAKLDQHAREEGYKDYEDYKKKLKEKPNKA